jgi:hypothetical protein
MLSYSFEFELDLPGGPSFSRPQVPKVFLQKMLGHPKGTPDILHFTV